MAEEAVSGHGLGVAPAGSSGAAQRSLLGERLVEQGVARPEHVEEALRAQRTARGSLGYHLLRLGRVTPAQMDAFLERELAEGRLAVPARDEAALGVLPLRLAHLHGAWPLALDGRCLAVALPPHLPRHADVVHAVGDATGLLVEPSILPARVLREAVERDYLGATRTLSRPAAGLPLLRVDDGATVRPLAPELRDAALSPETWLRSALAEAVALRRRTLVLPGGDERSLPGGSREAIVALVEDLAGLPPRGPGSALGRFEAEIRGRRPTVLVVRDGWDAPRLQLALAETRLATDDPDALFADLPDAQDAIEALASEGHGLVLACGPSGGGVRRLVRALARPLAEARGGAVLVHDGAHGGEAPAGVRAVEALDDAECARAVQAAADEDAALLVVEDLCGARSAERALLAAGRVPVLAGIVAHDAEEALAGLARSGLGGAVRAGLLRGVVTVVAVEAPCESCAVEKVVDGALPAALHAVAPRPVVVSAGCDACLAPAVRRGHAVLGWTAASSDVAARALEDAAGARALARERGEPGVLSRALAPCAPGGGGDAGSVLALLRGGA